MMYGSSLMKKHTSLNKHEYFELENVPNRQ